MAQLQQVQDASSARRALCMHQAAPARRVSLYVTVVPARHLFYVAPRGPGTRAGCDLHLNVASGPPCREASIVASPATDRIRCSAIAQTQRTLSEINKRSSGGAHASGVAYSNPHLGSTPPHHACTHGISLCACLQLAELGTLRTCRAVWQTCGDGVIRVVLRCADRRTTEGITGRWGGEDKLRVMHFTEIFRDACCAI